MNRIAHRLALAVMLAGMVPAVLAAPPFFGKKPAEKTDNIRWQPNLHAAHKVAEAEQKPLLLVFGADWCTYCKKLEKQTLNAPELAEYINQTFVPVHLDADKDKRATEILKVESLPCTIVLSPDADLLGRIDGYFTPGPFQEKLVAARQNYQDIRAASQETQTR